MVLWDLVITGILARSPADVEIVGLLPPKPPVPNPFIFPPAPNALAFTLVPNVFVPKTLVDERLLVVLKMEVLEFGAPLFPKPNAPKLLEPVFDEF